MGMGAASPGKEAAQPRANDEDSSDLMGLETPQQGHEKTHNVDRADIQADSTADLMGFNSSAKPVPVEYL